MNKKILILIPNSELTGLSFSDLHLLPFLKIGIILAFVHSLGTIPSCIDKLNAIASGTLM